MSFRKIAKNYAGHSTVNHLRKEYCIGDTHTNTAESFSAMLERTKLGVFHYMSKKHLSRYLNEMGFRWDHRIPEIKITKNGKKKKYMRPMPFMARLISLLSRCAGTVTVPKYTESTIWVRGPFMTIIAESPPAI